jgi:hypothetical protein
MAYDKSFITKFAKGVANGLSGTDAYLQCRPHVKRVSAATQASAIMRTPNYMVARALAESATDDKVLTRTEIRRLLTMAILAPKDIDSLMLPENAWLITGITRTSTGQSIRAINPISALEALAKMDGYFKETSPTVTPHAGVADLEADPLYIQLLEQELEIQRARVASLQPENYAERSA